METNSGNQRTTELALLREARRELVSIEQLDKKMKQFEEKIEKANKEANDITITLLPTDNLKKVKEDIQKRNVEKNKKSRNIVIALGSFLYAIVLVVSMVFVMSNGTEIDKASGLPVQAVYVTHIILFVVIYILAVVLIAKKKEVV